MDGSDDPEADIKLASALCSLKYALPLGRWTASVASYRQVDPQQKDGQKNRFVDIQLIRSDDSPNNLVLSCRAKQHFVVADDSAQTVLDRYGLLKSHVGLQLDGNVYTLKDTFRVTISRALHRPSGAFKALVVGVEALGEGNAAEMSKMVEEAARAIDCRARLLPVNCDTNACEWDTSAVHAAHLLCLMSELD